MVVVLSGCTVLCSRRGACEHRSLSGILGLVVLEPPLVYVLTVASFPWMQPLHFWDSLKGVTSFGAAAEGTGNKP